MPAISAAAPASSATPTTPSNSAAAAPAARSALIALSVVGQRSPQRSCGAGLLAARLLTPEPRLDLRTRQALRAPVRAVVRRELLLEEVVRLVLIQLAVGPIEELGQVGDALRRVPLRARRRPDGPATHTLLDCSCRELQLHTSLARLGGGDPQLHIDSLALRRRRGASCLGRRQRMHGIVRLHAVLFANERAPRAQRHTSVRRSERERRGHVPDAVWADTAGSLQREPHHPTSLHTHAHSRALGTVVAQLRVERAASGVRLRT